DCDAAAGIARHSSRSGRRTADRIAGSKTTRRSPMTSGLRRMVSETRLAVARPALLVPHPSTRAWLDFFVEIRVFLRRARAHPALTLRRGALPHAAATLLAALALTGLLIALLLATLLRHVALLFSRTLTLTLARIGLPRLGLLPALLTGPLLTR